MNVLDVLVILLCAIVQAYTDGVNSRIFCFFFGFVWTRCVLLFLQFYGIYFDGIFRAVL